MSIRAPAADGIKGARGRAKASFGLALTLLASAACSQPDRNLENRRELPPQLLQIVRESLNPGGEAAYKAIEEDAARICADLKCPNSHLAVESLTQAKEVWWLTPYESESDRQRVADGYAGNPPLMAALLEIPRRKQGLVGAPIDILASDRSDLSGKAWLKVAGARFFVVTVTSGDPPVAGAVFEAPDGTRYTFRPARTRQEADILGGEGGRATTTSFAVRPTGECRRRTGWPPTRNSGNRTRWRGGD